MNQEVSPQSKGGMLNVSTKSKGPSLSQKCEANVVWDCC